MKTVKFAQKLVLFSAAFMCLSSVAAQAQTPTEDDVVINEFVVNPATGREFVELLVTRPGGVSLQGVTLSDVGTRAGATGTTEGDVTLPATAGYLASVPQGTYVVIVATTPTTNANNLTEDTSLTDGNNRLVLIAGTTTGLVTAGTFDVAASDNFQLYAGTRLNGALIDQVLAGTNTSYITGATFGDNNGTTTTDNINGSTGIPGNSAVSFTPTENTIEGFQNNDTGARFTVTANSAGTPGAINPGVTDAAVTNPSFTTGTIPTGSYTGLTVDGTVAIAGGVTVNNVLTLTSGVLTTGANVLTLTTSGMVTRTSGFVEGSVAKQFNTTTPVNFEFPVGTVSGADDGYTPVATTNLTTVGLSTLTVTAVDDVSPAAITNPRITRYWQLTETGSITTDLTFTYLDADDDQITIPGQLRIFRNADNVCATDCVNQAAFTGTVTGITEFSPWTIAQAQATAADVEISGRVLDAAGRGIAKAQIVMIDPDGNRRQIRTGAFGNYRFSQVPAGADYTFTVNHKGYEFEPQVVTASQNVEGLNFVGQPQTVQSAEQNAEPQPDGGKPQQ